MGKHFSDLVLLVRTNPLPNYVVAKYFIKSNPHLRNIWLVYSERPKAFREHNRLIDDQGEWQSY